MIRGGRPHDCTSYFDALGATSRQGIYAPSGVGGVTTTASDTRPRSARAQFRILIAEDHALFAESLELVLSVEGYDVRQIPLCDYVNSPSTLLSSLVRLRPRIVLLDLDLVWRVEEAGFRSRSVNSWLLGERLTGKVLLTVADGRVAYAA